MVYCAVLDYVNADRCDDDDDFNSCSYKSSQHSAYTINYIKQIKQTFLSITIYPTILFLCFAIGHCGVHDGPLLFLSESLNLLWYTTPHIAFDRPLTIRYALFVFPYRLDAAMFCVLAINKSPNQTADQPNKIKRAAYEFMIFTLNALDKCLSTILLDYLRTFSIQFLESN